MSAETYDYLFKLLLVGDAGVGKSSLLLSFTQGDFKEDQRNTIGVDLKVKFLNFRGSKLKLTIWDTAGQERFRTLTSAYYRGAHGIILVYDITCRSSFENTQNWLKEIDIYSTNPDVIKLLVANKTDLNAQRTVSKKEGQQFARDHGMIFIEASAKTQEGVQQAFEELVQKIFDVPSLLSSESSSSSRSNNSRVKLDASSGQQGGGGGCGGYCGSS